MTPPTTLPLSWSLSPPLLLLLLLLCAAPLATLRGADAQAVTPDVKVVFTRWKNAPKTWMRQDDANLTTTNLRWVRGQLSAGTPRSFNFLLRTHSLRYVFAATRPGRHVLIVGLYENKWCKKGRRITRLIVNSVVSDDVDVATAVGCSVPFYVDVPIVVAPDLVVDLVMNKLPKKWAPTISNLQLSYVGPADVVEPVESPSLKPSASVSVAPAVSASISSAPDVSASSSSAPDVSASSSSAPDVSASSSSAPDVSASSSSVPTVSASSSSAPAASVSNSVSPSMSADPGPVVVLPEDIDIIVNVDDTTALPDTTFVRYDGDLDTSDAPAIQPSAFRTAREGASFELSFTLPAGSYDVTMGFVETEPANCAPLSRVFNVLINGNIRLEAYDIFTAATRCRKAVVERFVKQTVDTLEVKPFTVQFNAIAGVAIVNYVRVKGSKSQCTPETDDPSFTSDHLSHSVPGVYPPNDDASYVDVDNSGFVNVLIDGSGSHTHFFDGKLQGRINNHIWTFPETGKVVSTSRTFRRNFKLGTTRLLLTVVDNACSRDEAETAVTVTGTTKTGQYCYAYPPMADLPTPGSLFDASPSPVFAWVSKSLNLFFPSFVHSNSNFIVRCIFFIEITSSSTDTTVSVLTADSGIVRVYKGADLVLDSATSSVSGPITSIVGLSAYEVIYQRTDLDKSPKLAFLINGTVPVMSKVFHDLSTVRPIITAIDPASGRVQGGAKTKITGFGLYRPLTVRFGSQSAKVLMDGATAKTLFVLPPPVTAAQVVDVTATSKSGHVSNAVSYAYGSTCDPINFKAVNLTTASGDSVDLGSPTAVSIWQDGRMYFGNRGGVVKVMAYDSETLTVTSMCQSEVIRDSRYVDKNQQPSKRSILGITFDPRDKVGMPYVSVSTLFWQRQGGIELSNPEAWKNGAIERLKPADAATRAANPNQCLQYDRNIVRNLPVADGDHSVNEIVFSQGGDLLIAVGGNTNAGLPFVNLGGNWGTYFSGAVLAARLSRPDFDGTIQYTTPGNLRTAQPTGSNSDHIQLYATGVRNMFSMAMARTGRIYGGDMGPNCRFGNASTSCAEYDEANALLRSTRFKVPFPGQGIVGPVGECRFGDTRKDKFLEIKEGKYYGHSNLPRSVWTNKPRECEWVDPSTGRTPLPFDKAAPANYEHRLLMVRSPMTGLREYGANLFCGKLRGDIIMSAYKARGAWRIRLSDSGAVNGNAEKMAGKSGLRIEENVHGDLVFPLLYTKGITVLRPVAAVRGVGMAAVNVLPFRHGRAGGTVLTVGGWGFGDGASVTVGASSCVVLSVSDREIRCRVPALGGGAVLSVDVVVSVGGISSRLPGAVLYMSV